MNDPTAYHLPILVYAVIGVAILFGKLKLDQRRVYMLSDILTHVVPWEPARVILEIVVFVAIGSVISMGVVDPKSPAQAFAAGMAWTGLASGPGK